MGDLTHLPAQPDLADDDDVLGDGDVRDRAGHSERHREVGARLDDPQPAGQRGVDVVLVRADADVALQHGEQQGQPAGVEPLRIASPGCARRDGHGQRLDLDEQRPAAVHRRHDHRPG